MAALGKGAGAFAVAEDSGLASGVDVGEEADLEVVAADEGGGRNGSVCRRR